MKTTQVENYNNDAYSIIGKYGIVTAKKDGECIKLSIPNNTLNEWNRNPEILTLPYMNKEMFDEFLVCLFKLKEWFDNKQSGSFNK